MEQRLARQRRSALLCDCDSQCVFLLFFFCQMWHRKQRSVVLWCASAYAGRSSAPANWNWSRYQCWYRYLDMNEELLKSKTCIFDLIHRGGIKNSHGGSSFPEWLWGGARLCGALRHFPSSLSFWSVDVTAVLKYLSWDEWQWRSACLHCRELDGVTSVYHCVQSAGCVLKVTLLLVSKCSRAFRKTNKNRKKTSKNNGILRRMKKKYKGHNLKCKNAY